MKRGEAFKNATRTQPDVEECRNLHNLLDDLGSCIRCISNIQGCARDENGLFARRIVILFIDIYNWIKEISSQDPILWTIKSLFLSEAIKRAHNNNYFASRHKMSATDGRLEQTGVKTSHVSY